MRPYKNYVNLFYFVGLYITIAIDFLFVIFFPNTLHWFLIPLSICGLLLFPDVIKWANGIYDTFDPRALISLLGIYFFFLSPIIAIALNLEFLEPPPSVSPADWLPWYGFMGILNVIGILSYKFGLNIIMRRKDRKYLYVFDYAKFKVLGSFFIIVGLICWVFYLKKFGGFFGIISTMVETLNKYLVMEAVAGTALYQQFFSSIPLLFNAVIIYKIWKSQKTISFLHMLAVLFFMLVVTIIFDPTLFFGRRSSLLMPLSIVLITMHLTVKKIRKRHFLLFILLFVLLLYIGSFYKEFGPETFSILANSSGKNWSYYMASSKRGALTLFFTTFTRAPLQAGMLYRFIDFPGQYDFQCGKIYFDAIANLIPRQFWHSKPLFPLITIAGTDLFFGKGGFSADEFRIIPATWGIAGEAMLNFHIWGVPLAYFIFGLIIGRVSKMMSCIPPMDSRRLILPTLVPYLVLLLAADVNTIIMHFFQTGVILFIIIVLFSSRKKIITETPL